MSRALPYLLILIAAGAAAVGWWQLRGAQTDLDARKHEVRRLDGEARDARARELDLSTRLQELQQSAASQGARDRAELTRLQNELEGAVGREQKLVTTLEDLRKERDGLRGRLQGGHQIPPPLPEGVRLGLVALHECLRADGVDGMRFLRASAIEDQVLHDVDVIDHDPNSLVTTIYRAKEMRILLDRDKGIVEFRFTDGYVTRNGDRRRIPEEGHGVRIAEAHGPLWERRLPYLVTATGTYPDPAADERPTVSLRTLAQWRSRLENLLAQTGGVRDMQVRAVKNVRDREFLGLMITGYRLKLLDFVAEGQRARVLVDDGRELVFLELFDGFLQDKDGRVPVAADRGHRILLENVTPKLARSIMMGFVHTL